MNRTPRPTPCLLPTMALLLALLAACSQATEPKPLTDAGADTPDLQAADLPRDAGPDQGDGQPIDLLSPDLVDAGDSTASDTQDTTASDTDAAATPSAWGWISVIEWNDVCDQWYLKTQWFGGVRAHFAVEPSFNRALPHTLGFANVVAQEGNCRLYDSGIMTDTCLGQCLCLDKGVECYNEDQTERWCGQDEVCVDDPLTPPEHFDHGMCVPLPAHFDVGTVTLGGLKEDVPLARDEFDRYLGAPKNPNDLFDAGDPITASTSGGDLPPMSFTAHGVAHLVVPDQVVTVRKDQPSKIRWTPGDANSRVQVVLAAGSHDPNPLGGAIVCDAPDSDGQVEVAYSLLQRLYYFSCNGQWLQKCSRITRYSRDVKLMGGQETELFVGSARNLQILWE